MERTQQHLVATPLVNRVYTGVLTPEFYLSLVIQISLYGQLEHNFPGNEKPLTTDQAC